MTAGVIAQGERHQHGGDDDGGGVGGGAEIGQCLADGQYLRGQNDIAFEENHEKQGDGGHVLFYKIIPNSCNGVYVLF